MPEVQGSVPDHRDGRAGPQGCSGDAAILQGSTHLKELTGTGDAVPLYADLASHDARLYGPWLMDKATFDACMPDDAPLALPWRYGFSRLSSEARMADLVAHLESQRSLGMEAGDTYYLRYADTRALAALERVFTPAQVRQLKGPVAHWRYVDRFGDAHEFGADVPADGQRHAMIVLSEGQGMKLLEQQLAAELAKEIDTASGGVISPRCSAMQYRHVEDAAAFVLAHGIEPFEEQRHIAAVTVETGGTLLTNERFLDQVQGLSLARPARWHELMVWRAVSKT